MFRPALERETQNGGAGVLDAPGNGGSAGAHAADWDKRLNADSAAASFEEIDRVTAGDRVESDPEAQRRLLQLRHLAAVRAMKESTGDPQYAEPDFDRLPGPGPVVEVPAGELTPGLIRAGILRHGCLVVRGLVGRSEALQFAELIDRVFAEKELCASGCPTSGVFEEFAPGSPYAPHLAVGRKLTGDCAGISVCDSPLASLEMLRMFRAAGIPELIREYLGETPLISFERTSMRKVQPSITGCWHQDGIFFYKVRAINSWVAFSRCGDESPGMDIVPRPLNYFVRTCTEEAFVAGMVSQHAAEEAAAEVGIVRPIFDPGDALLFDPMLLHKTASDPSLPGARLGIENWFFGASSFPPNFTPLAI